MLFGLLHNNRMQKFQYRPSLMRMRISMHGWQTGGKEINQAARFRYRLV